MNIGELQQLHELAIAAAREYPRRRDVYDVLKRDEGKHFIGIAGPRGVGKTVLLRQLAAEHEHSFYVSVDTLGESDLFDLARRLQQNYSTSLLLLDEIHFQANYQEQLKKIYDFLKIRVVFTSSVSLSLFASAHDLSRRVRIVSMLPFSLREYIRFVDGAELPELSFADLFARNWTPEHLRFQFRLDDYLRGGLLPFALEEPDPLPTLENVLGKVVSRDIPSVARLEVSELDTITRLVRFVGRSAVDNINYTTLSKNLNITIYKAQQYVDLLSKAFVLNPAFPAGTNVMREPKVLMSLPYRLLYAEGDKAMGGLREDFFAEQMRIIGQDFHYLKSTRGKKTPDFYVQLGEKKLVFEIGGKGKGRSQFKGVNYDKKLILAHGADESKQNVCPLCLLGFLETRGAYQTPL